MEPSLPANTLAKLRSGTLTEQEVAAEQERIRERAARIRALGAEGAKVPAKRVSWTSCDVDTLLDMLDSAVNAGGCVRLGATRDGGAWAIGIYLGDEYYTQYIRSEDQLDETLTDIGCYFKDAGNAGRASVSSSKPASKSTKRSERGKH